MMHRRILTILEGLIDGSAPLPEPFTQRLTFYKDRKIGAKFIISLVGRLRADRLDLNDTDLRFLVFKLASYVRGKNRPIGPNVRALIEMSWPAIRLAMREYPNWLKSRAGVEWTFTKYNQHLYGQAKQEEGTRPTRLCSLDGYPGYYFVELQTARHVYEEGIALGHCMSWSYNKDLIEQRGLARDESPESLECLTYAVKMRNRELRIFSLRGPWHQTPLYTVTYSIAQKSIQESMGISSSGLFRWTMFQCAMLRSLSSVVELNWDRVSYGHGCYRKCPGNGWCEDRVRFRDEMTAFRAAEDCGASHE